MEITSKGLALNRGVKLITPAQPAGLAGSPSNSTGDQTPVPGPELTHQSTQNGVLFRRPRPFNSVPSRSLAAASASLAVSLSLTYHHSVAGASSVGSFAFHHCYILHLSVSSLSTYLPNRNVFHPRSPLFLCRASASGFLPVLHKRFFFKLLTCPVLHLHICPLSLIQPTTSPRVYWVLPLFVFS